MQYAFNFLIQLWMIINVVSAAFLLYHVCLGMAAFVEKKPLPPADRQHRFAALIAARNEENVIANLIESIRLQDYPPELIDVIVVADNCQDRTAEIAEKCGAIVYKRFNQVEVGKGYVLKGLFKKILEERDVYDAYCIIDADNIVDRAFFSNMNRALCSGMKVAQGYRDIKNPTDNWIAGGHSLFYWMENRFFNHTRSVLNLSATINGTAVMVARELIRDIGYAPTTVTEDIELTMNCVLHGYSVGYVPEAKVYDEQPVTLVQSMRQRMRWTKGLMQCLMIYFRPFVRKLMKKPDWPTFDAFMYMFTVPMIFAGALAGILYAFLAAIRIFDPVNVFINSVILMAGSVFAFWGIGWLTLVLEKKSRKGFSFSVAMYPLFNMLWVLIYAACIFNKKADWKPIVHMRNMSIHEIESSNK
jgi:cellulose synthase/poly-beta-1,6-N-acetylglucosamine synthase-like glycosyltransferase